MYLYLKLKKFLQEKAVEATIIPVFESHNGSRSAVSLSK
jgi:hypothetical protein